VAQAAADPHSKYLLTFDDKILSEGIRDFIKKLMDDGVRSNKLEITDEL